MALTRLTARPGPLREQVLQALAEIAFAPQFLPTRVEKERKAVLAEAQVCMSVCVCVCACERVSVCVCV
jgi:hypothetical protein